MDNLENPFAWKNIGCVPWNLQTRKFAYIQLMNNVSNLEAEVVTFPLNMSNWLKCKKYFILQTSHSQSTWSTYKLQLNYWESIAGSIKCVSYWDKGNLEWFGRMGVLTCGCLYQSFDYIKPRINFNTLLAWGWSWRWCCCHKDPFQTKFEPAWLCASVVSN